MSIFTPEELKGTGGSTRRSLIFSPDELREPATPTALDLFDDIDATARRHGLRETSGLRSPEHNRKVGGSPRSFHLSADEQGRPLARDFAGTPAAMQAFYAELKQRRGGDLAELIYGTADHRDHVHTARARSAKGSAKAFLDTALGAAPPKAPRGRPQWTANAPGFESSAQFVQRNLGDPAGITPRVAKGTLPARIEQKMQAARQYRYAGPETFNPVTWDVHRTREPGELAVDYLGGAFLSVTEGKRNEARAGFEDKERAGSVVPPPLLSKDPAQKAAQLQEIQAVQPAFRQYVKQVMDGLTHVYTFEHAQFADQLSQARTPEERLALERSWTGRRANLLQTWLGKLGRDQVRQALYRQGVTLTKLQKDALDSAADYETYQGLPGEGAARALVLDNTISFVADRLGAGLAAKVIAANPGVKGGAARVLGGVIEGAAGGGIQQPAAALAGGERDPRALAQETAVGVLFGALGGGAISGAPLVAGEARHLIRGQGNREASRLADELGQLTAGTPQVAPGLPTRVFTRQAEQDLAAKAQRNARFPSATPEPEGTWERYRLGNGREAFPKANAQKRAAAVQKRYPGVPVRVRPLDDGTHAVELFYPTVNGEAPTPAPAAAGPVKVGDLVRVATLPEQGFARVMAVQGKRAELEFSQKPNQSGAKVTADLGQLERITPPEGTTVRGPKPVTPGQVETRAPVLELEQELRRAFLDQDRAGFVQAANGLQALGIPDEQIRTMARAAVSGGKPATAAVKSNLTLPELPLKPPTPMPSGQDSSATGAGNEPWQMSRAQLTAERDTVGRDTIGSRYLYHVSEAPQPDGLRAAPLGIEESPVVWLSPDRPSGSRTGHVYAVDRSKVSESAVRRAKNGYSWLVHEGDIPADAFTYLGERSTLSEPFDLHRQFVSQALAAGKDVPAAVLADYPDLAKKPPTAVQPGVRITKRGHAILPGGERVRTPDVDLVGDLAALRSDRSHLSSYTSEAELRDAVGRIRWEEANQRLESEPGRSVAEAALERREAALAREEAAGQRQVAQTSEAAHEGGRPLVQGAASQGRRVQWRDPDTKRVHRYYELSPDLTDAQLDRIYQEVRTSAREERSYPTPNSAGHSLRDLITQERYLPAGAARRTDVVLGMDDPNPQPSRRAVTHQVGERVSGKTTSGYRVEGTLKEPHSRRSVVVRDDGVEVFVDNRTLETPGPKTRADVEIPAELPERLRGLYDEAQARRDQNRTEEYWTVTDAEADELKSQLGGLDLTGRKRRISLEFLRHGERRHGAGQESGGGHLPVTADDFARIPDVVANYDLAYPGGVVHGRQRIVYQKRINGHVFLVEEMVGEKSLDAVTVWKRAAGSKKGASGSSDQGGNPPVTEGSVPPFTGASNLPEGTAGVNSEPEVLGATLGAPKRKIPATPRIPVAPIAGGKAKPLNDILLDLGRVLGRRVQHGKMGARRRVGEYHASSGRTVVRFHGDLDTAAHEVGHALSDDPRVVGTWVDDPAPSPYDAELAKFWDHGTQSPDLDVKRKEGIAEYVRAYVMDPAAAAAAAPSFHAHFKSAVRPEGMKALDSFSRDVRTWAGAPAGERLLSNVRRTLDEPGVTAKAREFVKGRGDTEFEVTGLDRIQSQLLDAMHPVWKAIRQGKEWRQIPVPRTVKEAVQVLPLLAPHADPELRLRNFAGEDARIDRMIRSGPVTPDNKPVAGLEGGFRKLLEPFDKSSETALLRDLDDTLKLMVAQRTIWTAVKAGQKSKRVTGAGGGIENDYDGAVQTMRELKANPAQLKKAEAGAKLYRKWSEWLLDYMAEAGRMTPEVVQEIKANNPFYVDLHRVLDQQGVEVSAPGGVSKKVGVVAQVVHKFRGSTRLIEHPYVNLLKQTQQVIREADRNQALRTLVDLFHEPRSLGQGEATPTSDVLYPAQPGDKNALKVYHKGKERVWGFQEDVFEALKGWADNTDAPNPFKAIASVQRNFITKSPWFAARNLVRDTSARLVQSDVGSGLLGLARGATGKDLAALELGGGAQFGHYMRDARAYYTKLDHVIREEVQGGKNIVLHSGRIAEGLDRLFERGELSNRLAEYHAAYEQATKQGMSDFDAQLFAANKARDLLDFAVAGSVVKRINQYVPFTNARIQGLRRMARTMKQDPKGFLLRWSLYVASPTIAVWTWNASQGKDAVEEYRQLPDYQRDMFFAYKVGPNRWALVPKPHEMGVMAAAVDRAIDRGLGNKKGFEGYGPSGAHPKDWGTFIKAFMPVDESAFIPSAIQPVAEALTNYDLFRNRQIVPPHEVGLETPRRKGTSHASRVGLLLQKASRQSWDARTVDHLITGYLGGWGKLGLDASDFGREDKRRDPVVQVGNTLVGMFSESPASAAKDVQKARERASAIGMSGNRHVRGLSELLEDTYTAKTPRERDAAARRAREYGTTLRELLDGVK